MGAPERFRGPLDVLHDVFGYQAFRPGQREIIGLLTGGTSALAVMPTGAGKSLCYQIPAILSERRTVVVSPLVALIDDQAAALRANGVNVAAIHSGRAREANVEEWRDFAAGRSKLLYLSPERLMTPRMLAAMKRIDPGLFVIDEAHCISKWGPSFRPEYEQLAELGQHFPNATIAAFTATADSATRADIADKLFHGNGRTIVHGFDRPNLQLAVQPKTNWRRQLMEFLGGKEGQSGIVYCLSRRLTEEVADYLCEQGIKVIAYHAGQPADQRREGQDRFMSEDGVVMVATIAFGMGIDKPDIRFVCHLNLPGSMEAYYQEIGRAGRDGAPAETLMLYGLDDIRMQRQFIENDGENDEHKLREHKRLDALLAYCEASGCRRQALLAYFDDASEPCGNCDNCLHPPKVVDGTGEARALFEAIASTGQFFGASHIIDILRGAETQKIAERGHDKLDVFGIGKARPKDFWQGFIRQAVAGGHLVINIQRYGCLELTPSADAMMVGQETFSIREEALMPCAKSKREEKRAARVQAAANELSERDQSLLKELKALRLDLARERGVPAYVVFPDATLIELARVRPTSEAQMGEVNGVGPKKLAEYAEPFLKVIAAA
ncbi:MAG: DNA helicase RecQ [Breoghania sp.]|nr:DNA helicase RecQ [Breoghania sp.]MDJ0931877.1 DNA helicase RecQ [Breoghania sp.]